MSYPLQNGIYYKKDEIPGSSFCVIFLRASKSSDLSKLVRTIASLWDMYKNLQKGIVIDLHQNIRNRYTGNLSVLMGYGSELFEIKGVRLPRPDNLKNEWLFRSPDPNGGGPIWGKEGITYSTDVKENPIANDHIIVQFIGDSQLVTHRAVTETWKFLKHNDEGSDVLRISTFYNGFSRPDRRSWLDFHDGISNIDSARRLGAITINRNSVSRSDAWTINGTYLVFLRISIDLDKWDEIPVKYQERIIGRSKLSGCPLIGVDKNDNNISMRGCPVGGTTEVVEKGNERFREHPPYGDQKNLHGISDTSLTHSHIGRAYKPSTIPSWRDSSSRIFRQGYEFLENKDEYPFFRVGLNFVSFQASTRSFFNILKNGFGRASFGGDPDKQLFGENNLLSVRSAGTYIVPPFSEKDLFPGEKIFSANLDLSHIISSKNHKTNKKYSG